ncbi:hypothetical protein AB0O34_25455 [Sphaerisporangium sp. NPDC088356]|uniref:hypothetical protein n=1 Tax=Sphaerisporangium sp. NPDC088356 TaxID=3154871 RepID=UPI00342136EB
MTRRVISLSLLGLVLVSGCGAGVTLSPAQLDDLRSEGVAPDMIYLVDLPGYELAEQSMSVYNREGFQAYYFSAEGRQVWFGVDRGHFSDAVCAAKPLHDAEPLIPPDSCEYDEAGWYRTSGGRHEYAAVDEGHVIRISGLKADVNRASLKEAITGARHATERPA